MLDTVKALVKYPIIVSLNKKYYKELDRQYVSYDSWIRKKEAEYLAGIEKCRLGDDVILLIEDKKKVDSKAKNVIAAAMKDPKVMVVYGDEDELNSNRTIRMNPTFRPEWSPDTLLNYMYMGRIVAIRKTAFVEGSDIYDTVVKSARGLERDQVKHVDYVLYHNDNSTNSVKDRRFVPSYNGDDLVSVVVPSKDNPKILDQMLRSFVKLTTGVSYEIIVIDNGSTEENKITIEQIIEKYKKADSLGFKDIRYIYEPQEFNFARICNRGAKEAGGEYLLFLNDDIEIRDSKWLYRMMAYAEMSHVGAVGAKLYYPESKMIQHCGITNLRLGPVHKLQYKEDDHPYYDHANDVDRNVLAVTGACLLLDKEKFDSIGGFDEKFKVAFNDVDLCYSLYEAGYDNVVVNTTHLWHYESLSRGDDESAEKIERLMNERTLLYEKHPNLYAKDPYYHDYLTNDILDSNYTCAYEYEYNKKGNICNCKAKKVNYALKPEWENECLIISMEQSGSIEYFLGPEAKNRPDAKDIYFGGYTFVAGSDNSCFDFKILIKGEGGIFEIPCNKIYRPDLEINLDPEEKAVLCGFSLRPDMSAVPKGRYQVGVIAKGLAARLTLCRFTGRYIEVV